MMKRVLDSNKLIDHWRKFKPGSNPRSNRSAAEAEAWARLLIQIEGTDAIVTPVELEMLGGDLNRRDRDLTRAYLKPFRIIDEGRILPEDWEEARRLIQRIPRWNPRPRGLVDSLIQAIASRLNYEVWTFDKGMPQRGGPRRKGGN
jgi:predicted nucleic acid-binding protein